jgi:hypothetical protein
LVGKLPHFAQGHTLSSTQQLSRSLLQAAASLGIRVCQPHRQPAPQKLLALLREVDELFIIPIFCHSRRSSSSGVGSSHPRLPILQALLPPPLRGLLHPRRHRCRALQHRLWQLCHAGNMDAKGGRGHPLRQLEQEHHPAQCSLLPLLQLLQLVRLLLCC